MLELSGGGAGALRRHDGPQERLRSLSRSRSEQVREVDMAGRGASEAERSSGRPSSASRRVRMGRAVAWATPHRVPGRCKGQLGACLWAVRGGLAGGGWLAAAARGGSWARVPGARGWRWLAAALLAAALL